MFKWRAFSLFELMLMLALAALLALSAYSGWRWLLCNNQQNVFIHRLLQAIRYARAYAITQHAAVIFCGSMNQQRCDQQWNQGWIIILANTKRVVKAYAKLPSTYHLIWRSSLGRPDLQFNSNGYTNGQQGSFILAGQRITILRSGRLRTSRVR